MGKPLSLDLRSRLVAAVLEGMSRRGAAERFGVSAASAVRWVECVNTTGSIAAKPQGGDTRSHRIEALSAVILASVAAQKDISLVELAELLRTEHGVSFGASTVWRCLDRHDMTFKKTALCSCCHRRDYGSYIIPGISWLPAGCDGVGRATPSGRKGRWCPEPCTCSAQYRAAPDSRPRPAVQIGGRHGRSHRGRCAVAGRGTGHCRRIPGHGAQAILDRAGTVAGPSAIQPSCVVCQRRAEGQSGGHRRCHFTLVERSDRGADHQAQARQTPDVWTWEA